MSFFTRRNMVSAGASGQVVGAQSGDPDLAVIHRVDNEPLLVCCRHLARRAERLDSSDRLADRRSWTDRWIDRLDPASESDSLDQLQQQLTALIAEFDRVLADPVSGEAIRSGAQSWTVAAPHLLNLMLAAGSAALATEPSLTGLISDTVLLSRRGSRAAWRLRAQAHEQWGDLGAAITAHQEYLTLIDAGSDKLGVHGRVSDLREIQAARRSLASALGQAAGLGLRLPKPGAGELRDRLPRPIRPDVLDPILEDFIADLTQLPMPDLVAATEVLHAAIRCRRTGTLQPGPMPADELRELRVLRLNDVRNWLAGRTICLVADPGRAGSGADGPQPDSYDLVARFAPLRGDPTNPGRRTDLLVGRHDETSGWDQHCDVRMVLAEDPRDWLRSIRRNLVPGAQRGLLTKALRRPAHQPALLDDDVRPGRPTAVFQLVRLLDHLDVNPQIDLIGFTLDEAGPGSFPDVERDWLRARVRGIHQPGDQRISLR